MPTSYPAKETILRNPLTEEQRDEAEKISEKGGFVSIDLMGSLLFEIDRLRMSICDYQSRDQSIMTGKYYGPADSADDNGWGYLYSKK